MSGSTLVPKVWCWSHRGWDRKLHDTVRNRSGGTSVSRPMFRGVLTRTIVDLFQRIAVPNITVTFLLNDDYRNLCLGTGAEVCLQHSSANQRCAKFLGILRICKEHAAVCLTRVAFASDLHAARLTRSSAELLSGEQHRTTGSPVARVSQFLEVH
jgi:hypothetical protein